MNEKMRLDIFKTAKSAPDNANNSARAEAKKSRRQAAFILLCAAAAFLYVMIGAGAASAIEGPKNSKLLFSYEDDKNDDYGPGSYSYPRGQVFKSNPYMFDIKNVKIYEIGKFYRFDIEFKGKIVRSWPGFMGHRNGWLFNIAEIYIDTDGRWGSGHKNAALGRNISFSQDSCWDKLVFISPVASDIMVSEIRDKTDDLDFAASLNDFVFPSNIDVYDYTLSATVNRSEIGDFSDKWGIQVLSTVFDNSSSYNTFYNKRIYKSPSDNEFGGASDLFGAPNVLDILVPQGMSQKNILSGYRVHPNYSNAQFAVVPMIYGGGTQISGCRDIAANKTGGPSKKMNESEQKLELKVDKLDESEFTVKERDFEEFKKDKESAKNEIPDDKKSLSAVNAGASDAKSKNLDENSGEKLEIADLKIENIENNKSGEYKINKVKSDSKKVDTAKKSAAAKSGGAAAKAKTPDKYDEFMAKLETQKLKMKNDDEDESFKDIEKFLTKKSDSIYKKNAAAESDRDFDADIYEMARIESKTKKSAVKEKAPANAKLSVASANEKKEPAPEVKKTENKKDENLKPLIEDENEPKDNSIMGRLFGKKKSRNAKHAVSDDKKIVSEESLVDIAKNELPDNSIKKERAEPVAGMEKQGSQCAANMKKIYEISLKYIEQNPDAQKISMNMLIKSGLLESALKCEDGGRYLIEVKNSKPRVNCINVNNSGHGVYPSK
ncbi:MAG TPA: glucodextranase DOMON-like domain-containing protein [Candidatus Wallbacteria bacterium]|nr:MAG: hypothetical protein BWY32_02178 [bacterium ADurb.Bin243]HPG57979.1 glucodextranase DOMON-like domain-containing protein [Candidatus Wallbacteria bacterium]